jgi:glycosyltransferase involved in cell wall biosynthesis
MRLGVYADLTYRTDGAVVSNNRAFIRFVTSLPPRVDEVVLFGRLHPTPGRSPYVVPTEGVRLVALPYYRRVTSVARLVSSAREACSVFSAELERVDAVWIFGPHPLALLFALIARRRGVALVIGIRQDYPKYIANRLPSRWWGWAVPAARGLDLAFRMLSKRAPTVALGQELARRYSRGAPVVSTGFSLVSQRELTATEDALSKPWDSELVVLSVTRLDPEKNPLLLLDVIRGLRDHDPRWRMVVAGDGPLRGEMERRIAELGLADTVELPGEVPNGPQLWRLYRDSHIFLHVSFTEGLPQVLYEAQAAGTPIVATDVGGVSEALGAGASGILIQPDDASVAIAAVQRVANDRRLRESLVTAGLENAARETLEAQLDRLAAFIRASA